MKYQILWMGSQVGYQILKPFGMSPNSRTGQLGTSLRLEQQDEEYHLLEIKGTWIQILFLMINGSISRKIIRSVYKWFTSVNVIIFVQSDWIGHFFIQTLFRIGVKFPHWGCRKLVDDTHEKIYITWIVLKK